MQWKANEVEMVRGGDLAVVAAAVSCDVVMDEEREVAVGYYEKLAVELDGASPLEIVDEALELFGNEIAMLSGDACIDTSSVGNMKKKEDGGGM